jgi:lipopolysaccharide transport system permease protein
LSSVPAALSGSVVLCREFYRLWVQRYRLILLLAYREVADRFAGSVFGAFWALAHPLLLMGVYVVAYNTFLQIRFTTPIVPGLDYTAFFIAGYLPWMSVQAGLVTGCGSVLQNQNLVKQVVFPVEVLPLRSVLASLVPQLIGTAFLIVYLLVATGGLPATLALMPLLLFVQILGQVGAAFLLSALAVFVRDTRDVVNVLTTMGFFLLPIMYLPETLPVKYRHLLACNPLTHLIWAYHDVWCYGAITRPVSWAVSFATAGGLFLVGFSVFRKLKPTFGNSL